ncbi:MAG: C-type cytochrome biosis protein CcmI [Betaproteobacteria bacterium]|nr:C-type cytochrome biosis protein CcmI [Betaproteobacteria bacterium]
MTAFLIIAGLMAAVALVWVLPVLLRRREPANAVQPRAANLGILKDQLAELDADVAAGTLPQQSYEQARHDLERRAIEETRDMVAPAAIAAKPARVTAAVIAIAIPVCAVLLYVQLGTPERINQNQMAEGHGAARPSTQEVEAMVAKLAARMEQSPDDGKGWALLARSYLVMQRTDEAVAAYARATSLLADDADLLADYADALAMQQGRSIEGKPLKLIERALKIDPTQWKALAMAGSAAFDRKDYKGAIAYWQKLEARAEPGSEFAQQITSNIEEASQLGGIKVAAKAAPQQVQEAKPSVHATAGGSSVDGSVTLARELAAKAAPTDTVFVFARAVDGPRMPLAILRLQVKDLPAKFHLDDSMSMSPAARLSNYPEVVIGARVSKAGSAMPQPGDLQGTSKPVKVGTAGVAIQINQVVP